MRIAFVSEHASPLATLGGVDAGGQNVHVAELAAGLVRVGHDVTVYTRRDTPGLPTCVRTSRGYEVVHLDAGPPGPIDKDALWPLMPEFASRLGTALAAERPHVVHAHFWMSGWATVHAAQPLGIGTALTFHALGSVKRQQLGPADPSPAARLRIERTIAGAVDRVIATCSDEVTQLRAASALPREVSVVPCGVDTKLFTPTGPTLRGRHDRHGRHRLVCLGRLVPRKGFATVIEALTQLPDTELVVAGGGPTADPERARLAALAADLGVAHRVFLIPALPHTEVPALLRSADVVVAVPWYEPFGIVPLEAMACGVPVVASAVGGMLDTVRPGVTGLHVPPRAPAALANSVGYLLSHPAARSRYGRAATEWAQQYSWDQVTAETVTAYTYILQGRDARAVPGGLTSHSAPSGASPALTGGPHRRSSYL